MKLFSVFLGGRAHKCNTELHDVVFTLGERIETLTLICYENGLCTRRLHIDSWVNLSIVEGYKISISKEKKSDKNCISLIQVLMKKIDLKNYMRANLWLM